MRGSRNRGNGELNRADVRSGGMQMPRSRGAVTGSLLILLGAWGALIPFVGPYFDFAYTPNTAWTWTAARGWLEVFPGVATVLGGLLLISSRNRATAMFGGWLAVLGGGWFVVGTAFASALRLGDIGHPVALTDTRRALLEVSFFSGLGALIVFLGGGILARLSVRLARDVDPVIGPPVRTPSPVSEPAASEVSPDAETQAGANPALAPETQPRRSRGGLFHRRRAGV